MEYQLREDIRDRILAAVEREAGELIAQTQKAVRINSVNPDHEEGKLTEAWHGETRVSRVLGEYMRAGGMETDLFSAKAGRENCVGVLRGAGGGKSLLFNGHVDVVGVGDPSQWKIAQPFSGDIVEGRIYGRGTTDMKAGLVSTVAAVNALVKSGIQLQGDVLIEAVCGEEQQDTEAGTGACIARGYRADAGIVVEPSGQPYPLALTPAGPGALTFSIEFQGKAGHTCMRDEICRAGGAGNAFAVSAMDKAVYIYGGLLRLEQEWGITKTHPAYTRPGHFTINPSVIEAGPTPWAIPERAKLIYTAWFAPQEDAQDVKKELSDYIALLCAADSWLKDHPPHIDWMICWPPYNVALEADICRAVKSAYPQATGRTAPVYGFAAVADATFLNQAGIPTVILGPGDVTCAHGADEYVRIDELIDAAKIYALTIAVWCGVARA